MKTTSKALIFFLALSLPACKTIEASTPKHPAGPNKNHPAAKSGNTPTIENFLRWPLEGRAGADRVIAALHQVFDMKKLREGQYSSERPALLADGHTLSFSYVLEQSPHIDIGVDEAKCVDPQWAASITGAELSPVYQDAHGVDRGRTYYVARNGIFLRINTTPVTYRCVTAIRVSPEPKKRR